MPWLLEQIAHVVKSDLSWWTKIIDLFLLVIMVPLLVALPVSRGSVRVVYLLSRLEAAMTRALARALLYTQSKMRSYGPNRRGVGVQRFM